MIVLTRLDETPIALNINHILWVEKTPDTVICLAHGDHLRVRESLEDVVAAIRRERCRPFRDDTEGEGVDPTLSPQELALQFRARQSEAAEADLEVTENSDAQA